MKAVGLLMAVALTVVVMAGININTSHGRLAAVFPTTASAQSSACTFPTSPAASPEQTAWQLFVAANCPGSGGQVVWEGWLEQLKVYPACPTCSVEVAATQRPQRLHGSPLARALETRDRHALLAPNTNCGTMHGRPPNVVNTIICEEARLNPEAVGFLTSAGYQFRPAQTAAAQQQNDIEFPTPAIEVKVDWIPGTDFNPPFTCSNPPIGVHVETINGTCYAMAGIHISSKLLKNWLWATFEPQSMLTNPLRCITFGPCSDSWGSVPAVSRGSTNGFTQPTPALRSLMTQANLAPEFLNYRLDGVQIDFTTANGQPTYLGNSIIEGENVGMTKNTASCITCHSVSSIKNDGTDGLNTLINMPNSPVGPAYKAPANWVARDFVWSMAFACPDPTGTGIQACH
jgi:hypothetical protein